MVECPLNLDDVFRSLVDPTRRDMLRRVCLEDLAISDLAKHYDLSFAAIAKHLTVLEKAKLITKKRKGKQQIVTASREAIDEASKHLEQYKKLWNERYDQLDILLANN